MNLLAYFQQKVFWCALRQVEISYQCYIVIDYKSNYVIGYKEQVSVIVSNYLIMKQ